MKLATINDGGRDGRLVVVSADLKRATFAHGIADTLQEALERWEDVEHELRAAAIGLEAETSETALDCSALTFMAPLPRAWQWLDGSAFESHGALMAQVFGMDPAPRDRPLMYQGVSNLFYSGADDIPFRSEADGIDFEGEFGVIVDETPAGVSEKEAEAHIRLIVLINDWSLRTLAPIEMKTGFGWVQAKPPCSVASVAVTPDSIGRFWADGRVQLPLLVDWNGERFGAAHGGEMAYSFPALVAHAAATRSLCAGTLIGSGTVSNSNYRTVGSSCIAERRAIELLDDGRSSTSYMKFGDSVRMETLDDEGRSVFGVVEQRIVAR